MNIINEGKRLDFEYGKDWTDIPRDIFDQIIALDPATNIEQDRLGPSSKQLLLPRYLEGENFLDNGAAVADALKKYTSNRGAYPAQLRNIANFPTVADFVDYVNNGDASAFASKFDLNTTTKVEQENPIDKIYNKYYSDIARDTFNKIIALDPKTTATNIGEVAKNLLLPATRRGEDVLAIRDIKDAVEDWYTVKETLPADKKDISKYTDLKEFVNYIMVGPDSEFKVQLKEKVPADQINFLASTPTYDVIQPLTWEANTYIVQKPSPTAPRETAKLSWCTGYYTSNYYWNNYSQHGPIVCFISKQDPTDQKNCYQLNLNESGQVREFLNGYDSNPLGTADKLFKSFLTKNPDVLFAIKDLPIFKNNSIVKSLADIIKDVGSEYTYTSDSDEVLERMKNNGLDVLIKEVIIDAPVVSITAFEGFSALRKVTFTSKVTTISPEAFFNCVSLKTVKFNDGLKTIGSEAFANCLMLSGSVFIPNSVEKIGREAFRDTKVTLSLDKNRTTPLKFAAQDKEWLSRHVKAITVQPTKTSESLNESEIIDENIPKDLAKAYYNSEKAPRGIQNHPDSEHPSINRRAPRRGVRYDYANSNYRQISSDEAIELIKNNLQQLENLRLIIGGKLIEYELRDGRRPYQSYYTEIPWDILERNDVHFHNGRGEETNDSRFITTLAGIKQLLRICDKIYLTDEYDHMITSDTPTRRGKIKIAKLDADGQPVVDDQGNPIYDIVPDTIENRRQRNRNALLYRSLIPNTSSRYRAHSPGSNFGGDGSNAKAVIEVPDTGAHSPTERYPSRVYAQRVDPAVAGSDIPVQLSSALTNNYYDYASALAEKKFRFTRFDWARSALKKLERERDSYDEDEYEEEYAKLKADRDTAYQNYLAVADNARKMKDKVLTSADHVTANMNGRLKVSLLELQNYLKKLYEDEQALMKLRAEKVDSASPALAQLEEERTKLNRDLEVSQEEQRLILERIQKLQEQLEKNAISVSDIMQQLSELQTKTNAAREEGIKEKFKRIDTLTARIDELQQQYPQFSGRYNKSKKQAKEFTPEVANIISFDEPSAENQAE